MITPVIPGETWSLRFKTANAGTEPHVIKRYVEKIEDGLITLKFLPGTHDETLYDLDEIEFIDKIS